VAQYRGRRKVQGGNDKGRGCKELVVVVEAAVETIETLQDVGHNCDDQGPWKSSVQREGM